MSLAARIREARKRLGISALEVDRRACLTHGHTNQIERGVYRSPRAETAMAIARVLGVTLDALISNDTDESGPLPEATAATGTDS